MSDEPGGGKIVTMFDLSVHHDERIAPDEVFLVARGDGATSEVHAHVSVIRIRDVEVAS